jgi:hypothetical protein
MGETAREQLDLDAPRLRSVNAGRPALAFAQLTSVEAAQTLQRAAGNRAVGPLLRERSRRLQRDYADSQGKLVRGGNLLGGQFAAFIPGVGEAVVQVRPWVAKDGTNNNYLELGGYQMNAVQNAAVTTSSPGT